jgi:hypothetical protein
MNTGAIKSPEDKRDIQLGKIEMPVSLPDVYLPDYSEFEVYNQGSQPSCGGNAGARLKSVLDYFDNNEIRYYSPRFLYACCKFLDGILSDGTTMRSIGDALSKYGICDSNKHPNIVSLPLPEYKDFHLISDEAFENAQPRVISAYAFTGTSIEAIKQGIYKHKAVILLINPFFEGYPDGHFVVADGWNGNEIRFINSFGLEWGNRGYGWYKGGFQQILEGMTFVDIPDSTVQNLTSQITLLRKVVELLLKLKSLLK